MSPVLTRLEVVTVPEGWQDKCFYLPLMVEETEGWGGLSDLLKVIHPICGRWGQTGP